MARTLTLMCRVRDIRQKAGKQKPYKINMMQQKLFWGALMVAAQPNNKREFKYFCSNNLNNSLAVFAKDNSSLSRALCCFSCHDPAKM